MGRGDGGVSRVRSFVRSIDRITEDGRTGMDARAGPARTYPSCPCPALKCHPLHSLVSPSEPMFTVAAREQELSEYSDRLTASLMMVNLWFSLETNGPEWT